MKLHPNIKYRSDIDGLRALDNKRYVYLADDDGRVRYKTKAFAL